MKIGWPTVVVLLIIAASAVAFFIFTRRKGGKQNSSLRIKAPGMSMEATSNASADAGIVVEDAKSTAGGLVADDESGRGIRATRIETKDDILLSNSAPPGDNGPKP